MSGHAIAAREIAPASPADVTRVVFYIPAVEKLLMPEPEALEALREHEFSDKAPPAGVKVIDKTAPVEPAKPKGFDEWPEEAQEVWLEKADSDAKAEAEIPKKVVFYAAPIERIEMATIDALEAVRNWPEQYTFAPPPKGVKVLDRVEKPKDAQWIAAGMLPEERPTNDRERREFNPEPASPRLGPGGSHLIGAQRGPDQSFPIGQPSERPDFG
jgi:hypothetical protein